ncbi:ERC protein 2 isoform X2 [Camponotus floridanus]|uniref:ERC protein 2 isoform X2 n=1 Tax=Camponotus floridanus TaxID=104421 RepID=UPI000DC6ACF5|nr:ERC protein 2 isoform X2 [Camponotus floridanus]
MGRMKISRKIQVETWLTRDKISRYRGILKLHARDKKLQLSQATKLKSIVSKKIVSLEVDIKRHREIVTDLSDDGKRHVLGSLADHRLFYLAFSHLKPSEIYAAIYQDCSVKRRLLDKLYYKRKKKLQRGIELQSNRCVLLTDLEEQTEELPHCEQQKLIARLQQSITKYDAAKAIYSTYCSMLNILRKDAIFFDSLLNILKEDQSSQCKAMLRVTVMGQLAAESLDDVRQKYKRMTRIVLRNMKIREQMLSTIRCQVDDLWAYAQSLIRVESDHIFAKKDPDVSVDKILENQLALLENICIKVKETLLVRSYYDLLSRLETQYKQKRALLARLDTNIKNRDLLLSKKNYALQFLENLKHSTKPTTEQYKINDVHDILEQIETEKKREKDLKEQKKTLGELFTNIRAALLNINMILLCVKLSTKSTKKLPRDANKTGLKESIITIDREDVEERDMLLELEGIDTDGKKI